MFSFSATWKPKPQCIRKTNKNKRGVGRNSQDFENKLLWVLGSSRSIAGNFGWNMALRAGAGHLSWCASLAVRSIGWKLPLFNSCNVCSVRCCLKTTRIYVPLTKYSLLAPLCLYSKIYMQLCYQTDVMLSDWWNTENTITLATDNHKLLTSGKRNIHNVIFCIH